MAGRRVRLAGASSHAASVQARTWNSAPLVGEARWQPHVEGADVGAPFLERGEEGLGVGGCRDDLALVRLEQADQALAQQASSGYG